MKRFTFFSLAGIVFMFFGMYWSEQAVIGASATVVVTESEIIRQPENTTPTGMWVFYNRNAGGGSFIQGPDSPPSGVGSFQFLTPTGSDKGTLFYYGYAAVQTPLSSIEGITYSTFRDSGASPNQVPALNIQVDVNGPAPGGFTTLVFEPVYNSIQGAIVDDVWQDWDAYNNGTAEWWSTQNIPGVCAFTCYVSWEEIVTANPDAVIIGGFGINQGSGNPALTAAADALEITVNGDSVLFDFEPYLVASNKNQCKNDGWINRKRANGTSFTNQGDCVSYVTTGN
jgi:hypothetical protein